MQIMKLIKLKTCLRLFAVLSLLLMIGAGDAFCYSAGPLDGYAGDPPANNTCVACHNSHALNTEAGQMIIVFGFPPEYTPNQLYNMFLSISLTGQTRWGFECTTIKDNGERGGNLNSLVDVFVQKSTGSGNNRDYLKHTLAGSQFSMWQFTWQAPAAGSGPVHLYYALNAANSDNTNQGDYIYAYSTVSTEGSSAVPPENPAQPKSPALVSAFPNPFNPDVTIDFENVPLGEVNVSIVDVSGRAVRQLKAYSSGQRYFTLPLNLDELPSGSYIVRAEYRGGVAVVPITKVR
ncbi:MAG: T9SS type A sorting domain-containing protein [bacterium]|nr:T9SS type A sorting domain-containing protein [bacterium]